MAAAGVCALLQSSLGEQRSPREGREQQRPSLVLNWESVAPDLITAGNTLLKEVRNAKTLCFYLVICGIFTWSVYCRPVLENLKDRAKLHSLQFYQLFWCKTVWAVPPVIVFIINKIGSFFCASNRTFFLAIYHGQMWERIIPPSSLAQPLLNWQSWGQSSCACLDQHLPAFLKVPGRASSWGVSFLSLCAALLFTVLESRIF